MAFWSLKTRLLILIGCFYCAQTALKDENIITNFTVNIVRTKQTIIFACDPKDIMRISVALFYWNQLVYPVNLNSNYTLTYVLTRKNHAKTSVVVDCSCNKSKNLLKEASATRYFNKTYQWLLWDADNFGIENLLPLKYDYVGPNAQITYLNVSDFNYSLWDVHSKGRHLKCLLKLNLIANIKIIFVNETFTRMVTYKNILRLQGIQYRDKFNGLTLRGASVIDQNNITSNEQIEEILSRPTKDSGVAAFIKYHYELLGILRERFNFSVNFRNARGWAGRLGNTTFRLGFLGIVQRNEADIGASGAFNRINRFAEFDTIHQSWKFETAFLYRFTPDLDTHGRSGSFLAPFDGQVWFFVMGTMFAVNIIWRWIEKIHKWWQWRFDMHQYNLLQQRRRKPHDLTQQTREIFYSNESEVAGVNIGNGYNDNEISITGLSLKTLAAVCQQGMEPIPNGLSSRTIIITMFMFSLLMYNHYTSSVVGGLLSSTAQGPSTIDEIISSPLKLSFEDIGYYKVLFRENKSPLITRLISFKVLPTRNQRDLPVYTHIEEAIPYLKNGSTAFHCEVVDAFPEIARLFDASEICDLRVVSGLMETQLMNWVVHKNSQYTEIFRIAKFGHCNVVECGIVSPERIVPEHIHKPDYYFRFINPGNTLGEPEIKNLEQVHRMRASGNLAARLLASCANVVKIGVTTDEIDAYMHELIIAANAYPSPLRYAGFPKSVCTSVNNVACHGIPDDRRLLDGDIVNVDVTVFLNGYHGDCSKTFLVGNVDERGKYLVEQTRNCLTQCIALCAPGVNFNSIGHLVDEFCKQRKLCVIPAFIGHGIGSYFHGPPEILHYKNNVPGEMKAGMTFTIEPILSLGGPDIELQEDGWTAISVDGARSAQFEHTILITETGSEILTKPPCD